MEFMFSKDYDKLQFKFFGLDEYGLQLVVYTQVKIKMSNFMYLLAIVWVLITSSPLSICYLQC